MGKIKILDESTIQQIAAGEVIERPSSIVKELIENSIDAGSKSIIIEIKDGGKSYIRITDDGEGMNEEDIKLAFKRHSTSKLTKVEDIYSVLSLGFRGEALSSISSVSNVELLSKTKDSDVGIQASIKDGDIIESNIVGSPKGTTIIVRDVFFNLPVRKKFLKSSNVESNQIGEIINKLALGNPDVAFKFIKDRSNVLKTPQSDNLLNTIYNVLGRDYYKNLIPVGYLDDDLKIDGYISNNNLYRSNRNHHYLYINGRYISHLNISKIIEKEYRTLIPLNRLPVFILNIELKPNEVDINIHPTKQEVKFVNSEHIYDIIATMVREKLMPSVTVPEMKISKNKDIKEKKNLLSDFFSEKEVNINKEENADVNIIVKDLTFDTYKDIKEEEGNNENNDVEKHEDIDKIDRVLSISKKTNDKAKDINKKLNIDKDELLEEQKIQNILLDIKPIGRVFDTYIVVESTEEEKIFFIDQHAAHERVMYEKYMKEYKEEKVVTQELLHPVIIELTNGDIYMVNENKEIFEKLGFVLGSFGDNSVALRGVPMVFGEPRIRDLFLDVLDGLSSNIQSSYETKIDKIMKISCTNAIKGGDKIDDLEIVALFESLKKCENPYTCPHGRPTIIELSKKYIEKQFLRIV